MKKYKSGKSVMAYIQMCPKRFMDPQLEGNYIVCRGPYYWLAIRILNLEPWWTVQDYQHDAKETVYFSSWKKTLVTFILCWFSCMQNVSVTRAWRLPIRFQKKALESKWYAFQKVEGRAVRVMLNIQCQTQIGEETNTQYLKKTICSE